MTLLINNNSSICSNIIKNEFYRKMMIFNNSKI